jgi:hypothetical protein
MKRYDNQNPLVTLVEDPLYIVDSAFSEDGVRPAARTAALHLGVGKGIWHDKSVYKRGEIG